VTPPARFLPGGSCIVARQDGGSHARTPRSLVLAIVLLAAFSAAAAEVVVLKDGRNIPLAKPWVVKGKVAILTLPDKTVLSVRVSEIDREDRRGACSGGRPPPEPKAAARPLTPAEAAKVKSPRKAVVTLTDDSVAIRRPRGRGAPAVPGERTWRSARDRQAGGERLHDHRVADEQRKGQALSVTLTVEAAGDDGKTVASGFAEIAKDILDSGEKTTFKADLSTAGAVTNFRYSRGGRKT